MEQKSI